MKKRTLGFSENVDADGVVNTIFSVDLEMDEGESYYLDIPVDGSDVEFFRQVYQSMNGYYSREYYAGQ